MKKRKIRWFAFLGLLVLAGVLPFTLCRPYGEKVIGRVPIGSKLADLDHFLEGAELMSREVYEFTPTSEPADITKNRVSNEFGTFEWKFLVCYDDWNASVEERNSFTGQIVFSYNTSWHLLAEIFLFYYEGELREKNWNNVY